LVGLPVVQWGTGIASHTVTGWSYSDLVYGHAWLDRAMGPLQFGLGLVTRENGVHFRLGVLTFAMFAGIIALSSLARRFWCRNLCPLGALLGIFGKASPIRLAVSDKCTGCMRCAHECKMAAISEDPRRYSGPECIECYVCAAVCPEGAISLSGGRENTGREDGLSLDRRRLLQAGGLGFAAAALPKADWAARRTEAGEKIHKVSSFRLIRPPGSLAEDAFVTACVRCGECMKVCPTNALQPAWGEGGLEALETPIIVPRTGACQQACDLCGRVCPTRAIEPFTEEEKSYLYVGRASIDRSTCIAWASDKECLVCDEACSYDAISQTEVEGVPRPVVVERVCVGCGLCEWVCPVEPLGAVWVSSLGDKRHLSREEQRQLRDEAEQDGVEESPYPGV
jgi:ferredoxin-type protein NapF